MNQLQEKHTTQNEPIANIEMNRLQSKNGTENAKLVKKSHILVT
jgi:hypothetical protein